MVKADLHVHSKYSGRPSDWFLQKFGTNESYTEPEFIYKTAREQGMDYITITDHNTITGSLLLKERYPAHVITGCEFTVYFPEDRCKIHILVYDIDRNQFEELNKLREDIYLFRDNLKANRIAYSVAHAAYSINNRLTLDHMERLILLFDIFEGINGSRNREGNRIWTKALNSLTPAKLEQLQEKHKIVPMSADPWVKGFTGGSDDHSGLYIGRTYTMVKAANLNEFVEQIKDKKTFAAGRDNDYRSFVFILYKIIYDYSKANDNPLTQSIFSQLNSLIYEKKGLSLINRLKAFRLKKRSKKKKEEIMGHLSELIDELHKRSRDSIDDKFDYLFGKISAIFDSFILLIIKSARKSYKKGDIYKLFKSLFSLLPGAFLSIPFFSTLNHFYSGRKLLKEIERSLIPAHQQRKKRVIWFTDTITDLNGVSVTLNKIGWLCHKSGRELRLVSSLPESQVKNDLPPNYFNLPCLSELELPHYDSLTLKVPSLLKSIDLLYDFEPDRIYISTPGPVGLFGLLYAKLIGVKTVGVYHTDFVGQAHALKIEQPLIDLVDGGLKWFYSSMDEIAVPSKEYISILEERGFNPKRLKIFKRGIEFDLKVKSSSILDENRGKKGINLLYAGRVSDDKNLDHLFELFQKVRKVSRKLNLIIAGDGPALKRLKSKYRGDSNICFTGRLKREELFQLYTESHLLLFPSNSDTFGMVVLEAQAAGLPAIVTDRGGPKEIVVDGETGFVISSDDQKGWLKRTIEIIEMAAKHPHLYQQLRKQARRHIRKNYNWEVVLQEIYEEKPWLKQNKKRMLSPISC